MAEFAAVVDDSNSIVLEDPKCSGDGLDAVCGQNHFNRKCLREQTESTVLPGPGEQQSFSLTGRSVHSLPDFQLHVSDRPVRVQTNHLMIMLREKLDNGDSKETPIVSCRDSASVSLHAKKAPEESAQQFLL